MSFGFVKLLWYKIINHTPIPSSGINYNLYYSKYIVIDVKRNVFFCLPYIFYGKSKYFLFFQCLFGSEVVVPILPVFKLLLKTLKQKK